MAHWYDATVTYRQDDRSKTDRRLLWSERDWEVSELRSTLFALASKRTGITDARIDSLTAVGGDGDLEEHLGGEEVETSDLDELLATYSVGTAS